MKNTTTGKVDFHLHSHASNVTDYYAANAFAIPESYSDPIQLHRLLKQRGMTVVTLTDHNSIAGALEMLDAGFTDVFLSAEMTATFPEDGCNVHVTVANMTEAQFAEVNRLRPNIHEMIAYVDQQIAREAEAGAGNKLAYFMTHPLMSTQNRPYGREGSLTVAHLEKMLLLCNTFEVQNGARTRALNELTLRMIRSLDRGVIERLAERHGIEPKGETPWLKGIVAGSDDHSGINPGQTYTEVPFTGPRLTGNAVVEAIRRRETRPAGAHGGPITLAHSILKLLHDGSSRRAQAGGPRSFQVSGPLQSLFQLVFDAGSGSRGERLLFQARVKLHQAVAEVRRRGLLGQAGAPLARHESFESILESEVIALLADPAFRAELDARTATDDRIFLVVGSLVNRIFARYLGRIRGAGKADLVGAIKDVVALFSSNILVSAPYLVSYLVQSSDCLIARDVRKAFHLEDHQKLVLLTDTFFEVNGVSASIRRMIREAERRDIPFTVVTCVSKAERERRLADPEIRRLVDAGRLALFTSVDTMDFPEYDFLQVHFPPLLELLRYLQEQGFTKMHISTPGTIGLVGLFAAKLLQIETAATYHTSIPEYVENYTRDLSLEAMAWRYMILFYHSVDEVLVPSRFVAKLLHKRGLRNRKLLILDRWVDVDRFHPSKRTPGYWRKYGIENEESLVKLVYVGRVAVEKNLHLVVEAYRVLRRSHPRTHLIIIGDGPYRKELERQLAGLPATFTGFLGGEELPRAIASADVKLFPSTTDTWGNAPLEAQACGLPVVVSDVGGPAELMEHGVTGYRVTGRDVSGLHAAMVALLDRATRERMGRAAREFVEDNRVDEPFTAVLDAEGYRRRLAADKHDQRRGRAVTAQIMDLTTIRFDADDAPMEAMASA